MGMTNRSRFGTSMSVLIAMVICVNSASCAREEQLPGVTKNPSLSVTKLNFSDMPDGPAPTVFGDGPVTLLSNPKDDSTARLRVEDGKLTPEFDRNDRFSSYFCSPMLAAPVENIGARWTFTKRGDSDTGVAALLITDEILKAPLPVHLIISPTKWSFGVWPPGETSDDTAALETIKRGKFKPPLETDGTTVYEVDVWLEGDRAEINLPDGSSVVVSDERIAEWSGRFAVFEAHAQNAESDVQVGFTEVWAGYNPPPK